MAAATADAAFYGEVQTLQKTQVAAQTQTLSIADQLQAGVRSLDLRGATVNDTINLNSGQLFTGVTLQGALNDMTSFLQANPSESIVVSLSANEAPSVNSPKGFNADLFKLLNTADTSAPGSTYKSFVYFSANSSATPDLGDVRGKIVFVPSADHSWVPAADPATGLQIGFQPTEVDQDSHAVTDPNARWNFAENNNGANDTGLIPTDLGNPNTLYRNNLALDGTASSDPISLSVQVNAIAQQKFGTVKVSRTTGIVGMDDPTFAQNGDKSQSLVDGTTVDETLINDVIGQNNAPILVTSDSDTPGDPGTLRAAILLANARSGVNVIQIAPNLTGPTGQAISLLSDLPQISNDVVIAGSVTINNNGNKGIVAAPSHTVSETKLVASSVGPIVRSTSNVSTPVVLDTSRLTLLAPVTVGGSTGQAATALTATSARAPQIAALQEPVIVNPVNITFGTALQNSQLSGVATFIIAGGVSGSAAGTIPGTFAYTPSSVVGAILPPGSYPETVIFTPSSSDFAAMPATVTVNVAPATPLVLATPVVIPYGTPLADSQVQGIATYSIAGKSSIVPGKFIYLGGAGAILHAGAIQNELVAFIPADTIDFLPATTVAPVIVTPATPTISTVNPVNITPGTPLNSNQLGGAATFTVGGSSVGVPGTFSYTGGDGAVLGTGLAQRKAVTFTPADTTDYTHASSTVIVNVAQTSPVTATVSVNPVNITFGTALSNTQLSGAATFPIGGTATTVPGTFSFTSAGGQALSAGPQQSEAVTFTPNDTANFATVSTTVDVNVARLTPTISVNPVSFTYGNTLQNAQLSGTATAATGQGTVSVPGVFSYSSAAGSVPHAGTGQNVNVTFTPTDTVDFAPATSTVTVNVAQATPTVSSVNTVNIAFGTALGNSQLTGTATSTVGGVAVGAAGSFIYNAPGNKLKVGNGQSQAVTFLPTDATDYTTAAATVLVNVTPFLPTVTVKDTGGVFNGRPFPASATVTGVAGISPGSPNFTYYLATDTSFTGPLPGAHARSADTSSWRPTLRATTSPSEAPRRVSRSPTASRWPRRPSG